MKKTVISGVIATVVGGWILMFLEKEVDSANRYRIGVTAPYRVAQLDVMGSNNTVYIYGIKSGSSFSRNSQLMGSNTTKEFFLPEGQDLLINVSGSNNNVIAAESVFDQISMSGIGANNRIRRNLN